MQNFEINMDILESYFESWKVWLFQFKYFFQNQIKEHKNT